MTRIALIAALLLAACGDDGGDYCAPGKFADEIVADCEDGFLQHAQSDTQDVFTCTRESPDPSYSTCTETWVDEHDDGRGECYWLSFKVCHRNK